MTAACADIPLAPPIRRMIDDHLGVVAAGVREIARPRLAHSNAAAFHGVSGAIAQLRRLGKLLRFALITLAVNFLRAGLLKPRRARAPAASCGPGAPAGAARNREPVLALWRRFRITYVGEELPQPRALARAAHDPVLVLVRRIAALSRALAAPMPLVRRLARKLEETTHILNWWPPKRPPPGGKRRWWDELIEARAHAAFELSQVRDERRRRRDSS